MPDPGDELAARRQAQRQQAWEQSAAVRRRTKALRGLLTSGKLDGIDVIAGRVQDPRISAEVEAIIEKWKVSTLLRAIPGVGEVRAHEVMVAARLSPRTRVSALSFERRKELAGLVELARR